MHQYNQRPNEIILKYSVRSGIRTHAHISGPVWRLRPLSHPDNWQPYIRLELTQQSFLTSHVSVPSIVTREESKWIYAVGSNERIFCQFRTFDPVEVCKDFEHELVSVV